jgi:PleD family two-component response regulator
MDKKRILVVDSEYGFTHVVKLALERQRSYAVFEETDPPSALLATLQHLPDLILLGALTPGQDGHEIVMELKGNAQTQHIPIILVISRSSRLGNHKWASGFPIIYKPVNRMALLRCINENLRTPPAKEEPPD